VHRTIVSVAIIAILVLFPFGEVISAGDNQTIAPDFTLTAIGENTDYHLAQARGKVAMLVFLATWCSSCMREIESLAQLQTQMTELGLEILLIASDDSAELLSEFRREQAANMLVLHDRGAKIAKQYSVVMLPTAFIVDRAGAIREKILGPRNWQADRFTKGFETMLAQGAPTQATATTGDRER
jgi:peroxiredoxin